MAMASFSAADVPDEEIDAITHGNAMRHFRYDPFAVRPRAESTVSALRAQAMSAAVDTSLRSYSERRATGPKMTKATDLLKRPSGIGTPR
jgi:hypothetical protein